MITAVVIVKCGALRGDIDEKRRMRFIHDCVFVVCHRECTLAPVSVEYDLGGVAVAFLGCCTGGDPPNACLRSSSVEVV